MAERTDYKTRTVRPGPRKRSVRTKHGKVLEVPADWALLEPGDATVTRRVKKAGPHWEVRYRKRRNSHATYSKGIWAPKARIERVRREVEEMRNSPEYKRQRQRRHEKFVRKFTDAIREVLDFANERRETERKLARAVAEHAAPSGSGTVARRHKMPIEKRARYALFAWLRHNTTEYDEMEIRRGERKAVKRRMGRKSRRLLERYRDPEAEIDLDDCPLQKALKDEDEMEVVEREAGDGSGRRVITVV